MRPSSARRGGLSMISKSGGLKPKAVAGRPSVTWNGTTNFGFALSVQMSSTQKFPYQVHPQQLHGNQGFWQAQGSGQENGDDLTDVGRDQVTDELFHVVVNGTTFFNSRHNGREVIVGQHHFGGGFGDGRTRTHGNTNFGLLQSWGIVDTVTCHGRDFVHALQVLDDLGFVGRFDTREETRTTASGLLFSNGQVVEFTARVRFAGGVFLFGEHANTSADSFGGSLKSIAKFGINIETNLGIYSR